MKKLLKYAEMRIVLLSTFLAVFGVACHLMTYYGAAQIIITLIEKNQVFSAYQGAFTLVAIGLLGKTLCHNASTYYAHKGTFKVLSNLRHALVKKLPKVSMGFFEHMSSGEIKNIFVERINSLEPLLAHMIPEMTANLVGPISIIICLFFLDFRLAIVAILPLPLGVFLLMKAMKGYEENFMKVYDAERKMNNMAVEYINGIKVIKAFGQSSKVYNRFSNSANEYVKLTLEWMASVQIYLSAMYTLMPAVLFGVLPLGLWFYMSGTITLANLVMVFILSLAIVQPILSAINYTDDIAKIGATVQEVFAIIDAEEMIRPTSEVAIKSYDVAFKDVAFKYDTDYVLKGIDLNIPAKSTTAIVGHSGSGKSTMGKLLLSFWDVEEGHVSIGGVNIKDMPFEQGMNHIAYVSQDNYLFNDTVMNNIRLGSPSATDDEIIDICKKSGCHEFISDLEFGYYTLVGGKGGRLSGGERQRLTIARAMLKDAPIVLLDEATAYIDPENESIIQEALSKLVKDKTLIVIAHRLSTVVNAEKIVLMDKGQVIDSGRHDDLMKGSKPYKDMYRLYSHRGRKETMANA